MSDKAATNMSYNSKLLNVKRPVLVRRAAILCRLSIFHAKTDAAIRTQNNVSYCLLQSHFAPVHNYCKHTALIIFVTNVNIIKRAFIRMYT